MENITGFIYYLQNPITAEIFYVGATQVSLKNRLRTHYQHLREFERGLRGPNKRYKYLVDLRPIKATISLLEFVTDINKLEEREIFYIKHFRKINPNLTNMTDGGTGKCTSKYYTEKQLEEYSKKISKALKGIKKPNGFSENLSFKRKGLGNPAAKEMNKWIVCFQEDKAIKLFKYGFEINSFINNNRYAHGNVVGLLKRNGLKSYNYSWKYFCDCDKKSQDIVQSTYESWW